MTTTLDTVAISDGWQEVDDIGSVHSLPVTEENASADASPAKEAPTTADAPTQTEPEVKCLPATLVANPAWTSIEQTRAAVGPPSEAGPSSVPRTDTTRNYLPKDPPAIHEALKALYSSLGALETTMYSSTASWSGSDTMKSIGELNTVVEDLREQARSLMRPVYMCSRLWRARGYDLDTDIPLNANIGEWMANVDKSSEEALAALQLGSSLNLIPAVDASTTALRELHDRMQDFLPVFLMDLDNYRTDLVERSNFPDDDEPVAPVRRLRNMDPRLASARQEFYRLSDAVQGVGSILRGFLADEATHSNSLDLARIQTALDKADSIAALVTTVVSCHAAEWDGQREEEGMLTYEEFVEVNQPMLADVSAQLERSVREIEVVFDESAEDDVRAVLRRGQLVVLLEEGRLEEMVATLEFVEGVIMPGKGHLEF